MQLGVRHYFRTTSRTGIVMSHLLDSSPGKVVGLMGQIRDYNRWRSLGFARRC